MRESISVTAATRHEVSETRRNGEPAFVSVPRETEFKRKSVRGGTATVAGQIFGMALQIGTTFVLARILSPTDYGLQSMVTTLTAFVSLFRDAGLSAASVQREDLSHEAASTLFWINVGLGFVIMAVIACMAPVLVRFYREPRLLWITVASGTYFFFYSLGAQHRALLDRAMRFTTNVKIDVMSALVGTVIAVSLALMHFGYWSLILQTISLPVVTSIAVWIANPWLPSRPSFTRELRSMLKFGSTVTVNSVVVYIAYNTEKILLGRYWGASSLGIYGRAYQLATLPVQNLISAVHGVAFSVLSRMQNDLARLQRAYLKSLTLIVSLTIPVVGCSAIFAEEIVQVVLGPKWGSVAPVLRLLAPTVLVLALINPFSWFLRATGQVARSLKIALLICPAVVLGIALGLRKGPPGVALGYSAAMVLLFLPVVIWATYGSGISLRSYGGAIWRPLLSGLIGSLAGASFKILYEKSLSPVPLLVVEVAFLGATYLIFLFFVMGQWQFYLDSAKQIWQPASRPAAENEGLA